MSDDNDLDFSLESILAEFGSGKSASSKPETKKAEAPKQPPAPEVPPEKPAKKESRVEAPSDATMRIPDLKAKPYTQPLASDTDKPPETRLLTAEWPLDSASGIINNQVSQDTQVWKLPIEEIIEPASELEDEEFPKKARRAKRERPEKLEEPPQPPARPEISLDSAIKSYSKGLAGLHLRSLLVFLIALPLGYLTLASKFGWPQPIPDFTLTAVFIILTIIVLLIGVDVAVKGIYDIFRLRPSLDTAATLLCILTISDEATKLLQSSSGSDYGVIGVFAMFFAIFSASLKRSALHRGFKTMQGMGNTYAVHYEESAWSGRSSFFKAKGDTSGFITSCEKPDCVEKVFSIYVPMAIAASLVMAFLAKDASSQSYLHCLTVILAGGIPMAGILGFSLPYSYLSKRLSKSGAALGGWEAARKLGGSKAIIVTDTDIFPKGTVTLNGLKVFGRVSVDKIISYTASLISASGSSLARQFSELLESQSGTICPVDSFACYEGGGLGAEIRGEPVLIGTSGFMVLMGVKTPVGLKVKNAVFVAINGELCGVFAVNYMPATSIKSALEAVVRSKRLSAVFATKDFNITPSMLKQRFKTPSDTLEFPTIEERMELSNPTKEFLGEKVAVLCREGLGPFATAIVGGRWLGMISRINIVVSIISGLFGLLLMFYLTFTGAAESAIAANVFVFLLAWTVPVFLISGWVNRF